jgi:hypothetical protein
MGWRCAPGQSTRDAPTKRPETTKTLEQQTDPLDTRIDRPPRCCSFCCPPGLRCRAAWRVPHRRRPPGSAGRACGILRRVLRLLALPLRLVVDVVRRGGGSRSPLPDRSPSTKEAATPVRGGRAGKYDEALTQLVARRPGVTVAQAAEELGVDATALYPPIRRLEAAGALVKLGRELHPPR